MTERDALPEDKAGMALMIHALIDGELDAAAALAVERRIAADPELAAEHARIVRLRAAMAKLPRPEVSDAFLERIAAIGALGEEDAERVEIPPFTRRSERPSSRAKTTRVRTGWPVRGFRSFDWRAMAASIVVTAVLASGATQWVMTSASLDNVAVAVANGHRRSLLATSPVDVVSSDRHTVKPWLDARLGVSPPAPDLAKDGFALVGGRVEVLAGKPVPVLVYRHNEHLITLVAEPRSGGAASNPADLSAGGFSLVRWSDPAFSYWAASDMERPELDSFVARFRAVVTSM
ncbi:anti-sigma factor [Mesorhizobium sp. SP-1A]|uniref:anti-sigma factor family protein n=1 Tax=Mesorhizobium sp. SP-1A TaxID=3077840 RepID=UPI0028F6D18D|nr:anti-sigma factor [Mesorhizobium sp. SP-1A]